MHNTPKERTVTLIIGSSGQLGSELASTLLKERPDKTLICSDLHQGPAPDGAIFETLDVLDKSKLEDMIRRHGVQEIYHLAAMLSAKGEQNSAMAWRLNMEGLLNVLELSVKYGVGRVFWPSSIAAFGPGTPRDLVPQWPVMDPRTVYGISKLSGELWCQYYVQRFGLDVRSLRYPGIISWHTPPGGGTTDYAVEIFHEALRCGAYTSFLQAHTRLPMMYIDDAVRATLELMQADGERLSVRTSYNITAMSFTPLELAEAIQRRLPHFQIDYRVDFRQAIADTWPAVIDDQVARDDWGWNHHFDLSALVDEMLTNLAAIRERQR
ncbi:MAG: NAD-dependent epimerase/dehydratase family protein [Bacteroidetes bacterium]|nr:NAD-dependent epimerase/dehydratase family protein [Bacteroidota bacterium]